MTRISNITVENYKLFRGQHSFDFTSPLVFLVGENNTGKTTLFEAVEFLKNGLPQGRDIKDIRTNGVTEEVSCTITLVGGVREVITQFSEAKYLPYVYEVDGVEHLRLQRKSGNRTLIQGGKEKEQSVKTLTIWNPETEHYENPAGPDTVLRNIFDSQFIWADTDPLDVADFGSTKICGRLLAGSVGDFFETPKWRQFEALHNEVFHAEVNSLSSRTATIEAELKAELRTIYDEVDIKFNFSFPDTAAFYKAGNIRVDDGNDTSLKEKGSGMQRALALAMVRVYAKKLAQHKDNADAVKPIFFFIDEPEICMHPRAQAQLMLALQTIAETQQVFVSTHSPYLLKTFKHVDHNLLIFSRNGVDVVVTPASQMNLFPWSPSWGEINYFAYRLPTIEFHDELYGALHEKYIAGALDETDANRRRNIRNFDLAVLAGNDTNNQTKNWSELRNGVQQPEYPVTLSTLVRNSHHHPESRQPVPATDPQQDLNDSIEHLVSLITNI